MEFTFEGEVAIVQWQLEVTLKVVPVIEAFAIMSRSQRFDTRHCTAAVRTLAQTDADHLGIDTVTPIVFRGHGKKKLV